MFELKIQAATAAELAAKVAELATLFGDDGEAETAEAPKTRGRPRKAATPPASGDQGGATPASAVDLNASAGGQAGGASNSDAAGAATKEAVAAKIQEAMNHAAPLAIQTALTSKNLPGSLGKMDASHYGPAIEVLQGIIDLGS